MNFWRAPIAAGGGEVPGDPVVLGVVGDHPLDADAVADVEGGGAGEEAGAGGALLVGKDLGIGQPGVVVDGGVDVVVAQPAMAAWAGAAAVGSPSAAVGDAAEFLHVDVQQRSGTVVLIAVGAAPCRPDDLTGHRITGGQGRGPVPAEHSPDGRGRHLQLRSDRHRPAAGQVPDDPDPGLGAGRGPPGVTVRAAGPIDEPGLALVSPPAPPLVGARPRDPHLGRHVGRRAAGSDAPNHDQPPGRSQAGISVGHERPPRSVWMPSDSSTPDPEVAPTSTTVLVSTPRPVISTPRARATRGSSRSAGWSTTSPPARTPPGTSTPCAPDPP